MVDKYFGGGPHVLLEPGCGTGLPLLVDNPKEVGTDRVANAVGVSGNFPGCRASSWRSGRPPSSTRCRRRGSSRWRTAPGVNLAIDALSEHTVTVRRVEMRAAERAGKNTVEALQSGIVYGFAGRSTAWSTGSATRWTGLVATTRGCRDGYLAPLMVDECDDHRSPQLLEPDGLRRVYERVKAR